MHIGKFYGQPGNVMFYTFYDIIAEVIAAQRFPTLALLALARKCHETCGYVTFCEISGGLHYRSRADAAPSFDHIVGTGEYARILQAP